MVRLRQTLKPKISNFLAAKVKRLPLYFRSAGVMETAPMTLPTPPESWINGRDVSPAVENSPPGYPLSLN